MLLGEPDEVVVRRFEHGESAPGDVDDAGRWVAVCDLGAAELRERAVGDLAERGRSAGDEPTVGLVDVVHLPEDEGVIHPGEGSERDLDAVAAEGGEIIADKGRFPVKHRRPGCHPGGEVARRKDDIREALQVSHPVPLSVDDLTECCHQREVTKATACCHSRTHG